MQSAMKGVKKVYDRWGQLEFFLYRGVKIKRIEYWGGWQFGTSIWYRVEGVVDDFWSLTNAKKHIDFMKKNKKCEVI